MPQKEFSTCDGFVLKPFILLYIFTFNSYSSKPKENVKGVSYHLKLNVIVVLTIYK